MRGTEGERGRKKKKKEGKEMRMRRRIELLFRSEGTPEWKARSSLSLFHSFSLSACVCFVRLVRCSSFPIMPSFASPLYL